MPLIRKRKHKIKKPADTAACQPCSIVLPEVYSDIPDNVIDHAINQVSNHDAFAIEKSSFAKVIDESKIVRGLNNKGAISYASSGSDVMNLFFGALLRGAEKEHLYECLSKSWNEDPVLTIQCILNARDCRKGKGERKVVFEAMSWLREHKPITYLLNLREFLNLGCYKDLLQLAARVNDNNKLGGTNDVIELELFAQDLLKDIKYHQEHISLASKWAPSEGSFFDKKQKMAKRLAKLMYTHEPNPSELYRKDLSKLRKQLHVVESLICADQWSEVKYSAVPSKAHLILKDAFMKHEPERYKEYLSKLQKGEEKINSTGLHPHELVRACITVDDTVEAQWKDMISKLQSQGTLENAVCVVDVSGSMEGEPMDVAIALGLITSTLTKGPFHNYCINFDSTPIWHKVKGDTLFDKVKHMKDMPWGMSTNIHAVFDLILSVATACKLHQKYMPKTLFIFTDMQFDVADNNSHTAYETAKRKFEKLGYTCPNIVFWNLRATHVGIPVSIRDDGTALISGFSAELLKQFLEGPSTFSPLPIMISIITKYNAKVCSKEV